MPAREKIKVQATVIQTLSNGMFQVELENGLKPFVYLKGKIKMSGIKTLVGDIVTVELYDLNSGIIIFREKDARK